MHRLSGLSTSRNSSLDDAKITVIYVWCIQFYDKSINQVMLIKVKGIIIMREMN